jgi:hypothetical protein
MRVCNSQVNGIRTISRDLVDSTHRGASPFESHFFIANALRICGHEEPILDVEQRLLESDFSDAKNKKSRLKSSGIESARELLVDPTVHSILTLAENRMVQVLGGSFRLALTIASRLPID